MYKTVVRPVTLYDQSVGWPPQSTNRPFTQWKCECCDGAWA